MRFFDGVHVCSCRMLLFVPKQSIHPHFVRCLCVAGWKRWWSTSSEQTRWLATRLATRHSSWTCSRWAPGASAPWPRTTALSDLLLECRKSRTPRRSRVICSMWRQARLTRWGLVLRSEPVGRDLQSECGVLLDYLLNVCCWPSARQLQFQGSYHSRQSLEGSHRVVDLSVQLTLHYHPQSVWASVCQVLIRKSQQCHNTDEEDSLSGSTVCACAWLGEGFLCWLANTDQFRSLL